KPRRRPPGSPARARSSGPATTRIGSPPSRRARARRPAAGRRASSTSTIPVIVSRADPAPGPGTPEGARRLVQETRMATCEIAAKLSWTLYRSPETAPTRQVVAAALALLVLGAVGAVQAGLAGASFMFDLEQVEPALARVPPAIEAPDTPRLARRVFLVVIDGLRLDRSYGLPLLDELRRRGVDSDATSHYPT